MAIFFILLAVFIRIIPHISAIDFLPHIPNFTPVAAIALFSGVYLKKRDALWVPLGAMFLADSIIGFYTPTVMASVYGSFLLTGLIGIWLRGHKKPLAIGVAALGSSTIFFLVTNFAVWAASTWYPHTWQGLVACYTMGLPFFRNTVMGDVFYVGTMFGLYELVVYAVKRSRAWQVSKI